MPGFPQSGAFEVTSATASGDGFVAVGFGAMPGESYFGRHQGLVWRSADGRAWTVEQDAAFQFVTPEHVVALGDSLFIFGTIEMCASLIDEGCVEPPESGWAVWRSTAGGPMERLPQVPEMQQGGVDGVIATSAGLTAFGWRGEEAEAVVWSSPDGTTWTATADLAEMAQVTAMAPIAAAPSALVAFGSRFSDELDDLELIGASSTDGVHFARTSTPALPGTTLQAIAPGAGGLVAVGDSEDLDLAFTAVALESDDGQTWTQGSAADGSFSDSAASHVFATTNGYLALGFVPSAEDLAISTGASWFSADGQAWRQIEPFGGQFSQLDASASGVPGIVAFTVTEEELDEENVTSTVTGWFAPAQLVAALR